MGQPAKKQKTESSASEDGENKIASETKITCGVMKNDLGLEYVKLVCPETGASTEIYLYGGVVTSYKDSSGHEFIAVRPDSKMDGSKPISGGLSHCWPQVRKDMSSQRFISKGFL